MALKPVGGKIESQELNDNFSYLDSEKASRKDLADFSKGPKEVHDTLTDLQNKYPNGDSGIHLVLSNGHIYFWKDNSWIDAGAYQAVELADNSVTFSKRTKLGNIGLVMSGIDAKLPNIDTVNKKITFFNGTYIYHGKDRYNVTSDLSISLPTGTGSVMQMVVFNFSTNQLRAINGGAISGLQEQEVVIAFINWNNNTQSELHSVFISCEYTVDDIPQSLATSEKRTNLGDIGIYQLGSLAKHPNIDLNRKKVSFYGPASILSGKTRRLILNGDTKEVEITPNTAVVYISFDLKTEKFMARGASTLDFNESEVFVMSLNFDTSSQTELRNVAFIGEYTVNGKRPLDSVTAGRLAFYEIGSTSELPDINLGKKEVVFPIPFYIVNKNEIHTFAPSTTDETEITVKITESTLVSRILFNTKTREFRSVAFRGIEDVNPDEVTIMNLNFESTSQAELVNVLFTNGYTVNKQSPNTPGEKEERPYYFSPVYLVGDYKPSELFSYDDFDYDTTTPVEYDNKCLELANNHSDYIKVDLQGKDQSGTYDIYKYTLRAEQPAINVRGKDIPKILMISGLHGSEKSSVWSTYYFIRDLCENWQEDPLLEYIRFNIEIQIIPNSNPWGLANSNRSNSRGVDLNRNWDTPVWVKETESNWGTILYGGEYPFSEVETQYIRNMILDNLNALYFCDYHTNNSSGDDQNRLMWVSLNSGSYRDENLEIAANYIMSKQTREFIKRYDQPNGEGLFGYVTSSLTSSASKYYAGIQGIPANTLECFRKFPDETEMYSHKTIKACTEYLGNWLLTVIKQFKNN